MLGILLTCIKTNDEDTQSTKGEKEVLGREEKICAISCEEEEESRS